MAQLDRVISSRTPPPEADEESWFKKGVKQIFRNHADYNDGHAAGLIAKDFPAVKCHR